MNEKQNETKEKTTTESYMADEIEKRSRILKDKEVRRNTLKKK